jgi:hypothetical protein
MESYLFIVCRVAGEVLGLELKSFVLPRQALNCLSHIFSAFCSCYFKDKMSLFAQSSPDLNSPIL